MAKFSVTVEVVRAYLVEVEADNEHIAIDKVDGMNVEAIETHGDYLDTHILVDDELERI